MVVEQGISTKSFVLSMVFTVLAFASMFVFLPFTKGKGLAIQILCALVTLLLFLLGILFWSGHHTMRSLRRRSKYHLQTNGLISLWKEKHNGRNS